MYIIGSATSDDQIPQVSDEVKKSIESQGGIIEKYEELGKRKLAYPVKKSRTGHYALVNFSAPPEKLNEIEHKIRTSQNIIRHLVVNMDEALIQMEKDRALQAKLRALRPKEATPVGPEEKPRAKPGKKIEIDLDAEIEKAIESDELK